MAQQQEATSLRIQIEKFPEFLESMLVVRFGSGLQGLKDRFQSLMTLFKHIMQSTLEINTMVAGQKNIEAQGLLESIVTVLNMIIQEYLHVNGGVLLDQNYVSMFLATIQERVEYIYSQFHQLEQLDFKDAKLAKDVNSLCKQISRLILKIPPSLIEIQNRAELSMPLIIFVSEALQRLKDPTIKFIERLAHLRLLKQYMDKRHVKDVISKFLSVTCQRDVDAKQAGQLGKTKREQMFEELNQLIAYTKRLEFELKRCLDTPIRMFRVLLLRHHNLTKSVIASGTQQYQGIKDVYFNEDMKLEDIAKLMKFATQVCGIVNPNPTASQYFHTVSIESAGMAGLNVNEFVNTLQLLELQKGGSIYKEIMQQPLVRENLEELYSFDVPEFKEYMEKVRKLHQKINQIYDFEAYDLDPNNNLRQKDLQEVIDALKNQHEFIYETEQLSKLYQQLKTRLERFCNREFLPVISDVNPQSQQSIEIYADELDMSCYQEPSVQQPMPQPIFPVPEDKLSDSEALD